MLYCKSVIFKLKLTRLRRRNTEIAIKRRRHFSHLTSLNLKNKIKYQMDTTHFEPWSDALSK